MTTATSTASLSSGGCACGAVRFVAEGEPYRVGLCHCLDCRKQYGAPFGAGRLESLLFGGRPQRTRRRTEPIGDAAAGGKKAR